MKTFNITPRPRMLVGVQNQRWTISGALAELIDNAFGAGRGDASKCFINYDPLKRTLSVVDNGEGMEYIGRLFQLGNTIGRTAGDIGHFGMGGTQAIIWLAEWVNVATERGGRIMQDSVRWSEIFEMEDFRDVSVSDEWKSGHFTRLSEWKHGTIINIKLLKERRFHISNIVRDLSRLFAPGLRRGKQIIWQTADNDANILIDPFAKESPPKTTRRFDIIVEIGERHLPLRGVISFDETVSHADSWVRIGFSHREIMKTRDCYKSSARNESFAGIGVSGWLDLGDGWQPYLTTTKDAFNDEPLYETLTEHVFAEIRELLILAEQHAEDFELDNLALGLQTALNRAMRLKVKVERQHGQDERGGGNSGGAGSGERKAKSDPDGDDGKGIAHIQLIKQTDDDMLGVLARSGRHADGGLYVDINKDHEFIREAMRQRPINAAALNLMIISEIATLFTEQPQLLREAFKPSIIEQLGEETDQEKARKLTRYLMDSIPDKREPTQH